MLRGLFVDRHFYSHDSGGRGRWQTFTRIAQIRLAVLAALLAILSALVGGILAYGWLQADSVATPALASLPIVRAPEPPPVAQDEIRALRAALEESRQKRADLAAELEALKRAPVPVPVPAGPSQADYDALQASRDEALRRAQAAEQAAASASEVAELAKREAVAAKEPIAAAGVPDRVRALELELEMVRAERPTPATPVEQDPRYAQDPIGQAFTPQEEALARRVRELEATVAELQADRDRLEQQLDDAGQAAGPADDPPSDDPSVDASPADDPSAVGQPDDSGPSAEEPADGAPDEAPGSP